MFLTWKNPFNVRSKNPWAQTSNSSFTRSNIGTSRDDNGGSGRAWIVPTHNSTCKKKSTCYLLVYPPSIRLKNTRIFF